MNASARFSPCGAYRYTLDVPIGLSLVFQEQKRAPQWLGFVMLNPSTADAVKLDPTLRRCADFARRWGFQGIRVRNLFAYRATDPDALRSVTDPEGPENRAAIHELVEPEHNVGRIVCAWGAWGGDRERAHAAYVFQWLRAHPVELVCLGRTADGSPRHPLYVRADATPVPYA